MLELAAVSFVAALFLAGVVLLREPKLLLPLVVLGLPIEYFATVTLDDFGEGGASGAIRALLVPGKAAMLATVVVVVVRNRHHLSNLFPDSAILLPIVVLMGVMLAGLGWSDSLRPPNSLLILPMYVAFVFAAPTLIEGRRDLERIWGAMLAIAIMLAVIAVAQRFGIFNWRGILIQSDEVSYRSNATFGDPNILARYFAVVIPLAVMLILATGPRRLTLYVAIPACVLGLAGIVASASRSGWLMLLVVGFLAVMWSPLTRYQKAALTAAAVAGVGLLIGLLLMQGGADAQRVQTLWSGVEVIGQREFLIRAGIAMWKDNLLIGVGSGNYQNALVVSYLDLIPTWARTTLSHTSTVSILAELGVVGAALFAMVCTRIAIVIAATYRGTGDSYTRLITGWLGASLFGILLQTQSEGRLIDEPYLWFLLAVFVAIETDGRTLGNLTAAPANETADEARASVAERRDGMRRKPRIAGRPTVPAVD